jgi:hypothetical protein
MSATYKKFSSQVAPDKLKAVQDLARKEGRQFRSLVDEAFADLIEKHKHGRPQPEFMAAYLVSVEKYGPLYKKLAE